MTHATRSNYISVSNAASSCSIIGSAFQDPTSNLKVNAADRVHTYSGYSCLSVSLYGPVLMTCDVKRVAKRDQSGTHFSSLAVLTSAGRVTQLHAFQSAQM